MKLTLKNVKFSESLSRDTNAFTADLFVGSKKVAYVINDGHGGCTNYSSYSGMRDLLQQAEDFALSLPSEYHKQYDLTIKSDLEQVIDNLFNDWLEVKEDKKVLNNMKKGILVGSKNHYSIITWKGNTIASLLATPQGTAVVKKKVDELRKNGEVVMNNNLPF